MLMEIRCYLLRCINGCIRIQFLNLVGFNLSSTGRIFVTFFDSQSQYEELAIHLALVGNICETFLILVLLALHKIVEGSIDESLPSDPRTNLLGVVVAPQICIPFSKV